MKSNLYLSYLFISVTAVLSQDNTAETYIPNAAFQDIAPCPCDLTLGSCDIGCCCDGECTDNLKATFSCIPGLEGGFDPPVTEFNCRSDHYNKVDWFPLLCIEWEYNALLGFFYEWQYKIGNNTQNFRNRLATVSFFSYRENETRRIDDVRQDTSLGYRYGISIKTGKTNNTNDSISDRGIMVIPQPILDGYCLSVAPVQFLKNLESSCTFRMSIGLCSDYTELSNLFYVQASSAAGFKVIEDDQGTTLAPTSVTYYCLGSDACNNNGCVGPNDLMDLTNAPVCSSTVPTDLIPNYVAASASCQNAVIYVDYTITWEGRRVVQVDAAIVLGTVPIQVSGNIFEVTQNYKVTFIHNSANITSPTDNFDNLNTSYSRAGRPGYDIGQGIFSGTQVTNNAVDPPVFQYVDQNSTAQMAVFQTGVDGMCTSTGRRYINFAEDVFSSCAENYGLQNFTNCTELRIQILDRFDTLMPANVLGRRGYNDALNLGYWVDVLRETLNLTQIEEAETPIIESPVDNITGVCANVPESVQLDIMYGETGRTNGFPIYEILGGRISYVMSTWRLRCSGADSSVCIDTAATQPFYLSSSVRFIKIPGNTPEPTPSYYITPEEDDPELCPGDRCWANLFYPFTDDYTADPRDYVFGMVLIIILFFIGYLLVTRPWW